jgi:hypothetical protein
MNTAESPFFPRGIRYRLLRSSLALAYRSSVARGQRLRLWLHNRMALQDGRQASFDLEGMHRLGAATLEAITHPGAMRPQRAAVAVPAGRRVRLGVLAGFSGTLGISKELLAAHPPDVELFLYDLGYRGTATTAYAEFAHYRQLRLAADFRGPDPSYVAAADAINADALDALVVMWARTSTLALLNLVDAPRIASLNGGSYLLVHPKCRAQTCVQLSPGFTVRDGRVVDVRSQRILPHYLVDDATFHYDRRGLPLPDPARARTVEGRAPLIVFSGSLYKLAKPVFLQVVANLLRSDPRRRFLYFGRPDPARKTFVDTFFRRAGVADRVEQAGSYVAMRNSDGSLQDADGWARAVAVYRTARLFLNSFPLGGGSSVVEACLAGVPVAHLAFQDPEEWIRNRHLLDAWIPMITTIAGSATTPRAYEALCERLLTDDDFASTVLREQDALMQVACDEGAFWQRLMALIARDAPLR